MASSVQAAASFCRNRSACRYKVPFQMSTDHQELPVLVLQALHSVINLMVILQRKYPAQTWSLRLTPASDTQRS